MKWLSASTRSQLHALMSFKKILLVIAIVTLSSVNAKAVAQTEQRPSAIFYLNATKGCYSKSYISVKTIPYFDTKKLYRVSCSSFHHFEVFATGITSPDSRDATTSKKKGSKESTGFSSCLDGYNKLTFNKRTSSDYNWGIGDEILVGDWNADSGPEESRFGKKFICYIALGVKTRNFFKEIDRPLIKGYEKYEE